MELLILVVISLVWTIIKALSESSKQQQQRSQPSSVAQPQLDELEPQLDPPQGSTSQNFPELSHGNYFADEAEEVLEVEEVDDATEGEEWHLDHRDFVQGIVMAEVLGPPRAKKPHKMHS